MTERKQQSANRVVSKARLTQYCEACMPQLKRFYQLTMLFRMILNPVNLFWDGDIRATFLIALFLPPERFCNYWNGSSLFTGSKATSL
jgi:hypothetical protein